MNKSGNVAPRKPGDWRKGSTSSGRSCAPHLLGYAWLCACHQPSESSGWAAHSPHAGAADAGCGSLARAPEKAGCPVAAAGWGERSALVDPAHSELLAQPRQTAPSRKNVASPEIAITGNYFRT